MIIAKAVDLPLGFSRSEIIFWELRKITAAVDSNTKAQ